MYRSSRHQQHSNSSTFRASKPKQGAQCAASTASRASHGHREPTRSSSRPPPTTPSTSGRPASATPTLSDSSPKRQDLGSLLLHSHSSIPRWQSVDPSAAASMNSVKRAFMSSLGREDSNPMPQEP